LKVLDTDTCVHLLRGTRAVLERRRAEAGPVATTWITAAELYYGAAKSKDPERNRALVSQFLDTLPVLGLEAASAALFGEFKALLERRGERLDDADLLIAAVAAVHGAAVVTGNHRHHGRIPGVTVEDWIRA
jgi:tRNA(fMet)-specific endonuclease VapC